MNDRPDDPASLLPQFEVRCHTADHAASFALHLAGRDVEVEAVEGRQVVLRYGGTLAFVIEVAHAAVMGEYASAEAMVDLLSAAERPVPQPA